MKKDNHAFFGQSASLKGDHHKEIEALFRIFHAPLCDYAFSILGDQELAEDVVQDLFVRLLDQPGLLMKDVPVKYYLYSSVRYRSFNVLRHREVIRRSSPQVAEMLENLQNNAYREDDEQVIDKLITTLEELPPQCRTVFSMSCLEGKTYKEIGGILNISINTVKYHITRAYDEIRRKLNPRPPETD